MQTAVADLREGMVVAADVFAAHGGMLVPRGTVLTERHVSWLERAGVDLVDIEVPEEESAPVSEEALAAAAARVEPRFALAGRTHPVLAALFARAVQLEVAVIR